MIRISWLAGAAVMVLAGTVEGQLKAGVLGTPSVGRKAPEVQLSYFTADGPGPSDQPFRLGAELGRVVVLVFGGKVDSAAAGAWAGVKARTDSLLSRSVIAAGVVRAGSDLTLPLAAELAEFKLLADTDGRAHRGYGIAEGTRSWSVFVIGDDGRLVWDGRVAPVGGDGWGEVRKAVIRGRSLR